MKVGGQNCRGHFKKNTLRRLLRNGKVPGASAGTRAVAASGPECASACRTILGREPGQQLPPLPNREDRAATGWTCMLEVSVGNKDVVADTQGQCSPTKNVDTGWVITREIGEPGAAWRKEKSWAMLDPDLDSLHSGWKVGLCERLGACWEWQA